MADEDTQNEQPKKAKGFYAMVPRIVRKGYPDLTTSEKWLYVCLKDLCGDSGVCYRTIRSLAGETGLSLGSITAMIPKLQKAKLIRAEKKPRRPGGHEVWHISIVDIWKKNMEFCSVNERKKPKRVQ